MELFLQYLLVFIIVVVFMSVIGGYVFIGAILYALSGSSGKRTIEAKILPYLLIGGLGLLLYAGYASIKYVLSS